MFRLLPFLQNKIPYVKELRPITGSVTSCILMMQLDYWFLLEVKGKFPYYKGFYKFMEPCNHPMYKEGDSWREELEFSSKEFRNAFDHIAVRHTSKTQYMQAYKQNNHFCDRSGEEKFYCSYYDKAQNITFYFRNHKKVDTLLRSLVEIPFDPDDQKESPRDAQRESPGNNQRESLQMTKRNLPEMPKGNLPIYTEPTSRDYNRDYLQKEDAHAREREIPPFSIAGEIDVEIQENRTDNKTELPRDSHVAVNNSNGHSAEPTNSLVLTTIPADENYSQKKLSPYLADVKRRYEEAEIDRIPPQELKQIARVEIGSYVKTYRQSEFISSGRIAKDFLQFVAIEQWNDRAELTKARQTINSHEKDPDKWDTLTGWVELWQELQADSRKMAEYYERKIKAKGRKATREESQIANAIGAQLDPATQMAMESGLFDGIEW